MSDLNLSILISAIDKFSAPAGKIAGLSEKMAARLHDGQKALENLGSKGQAIKRMKALQSRLGQSAAEMDKATKRTAALGRELNATTNPTKKLQREFETARRRSDALKRQHREQREELRRLRGELRDTGIDTRNLGDAQRKIAGNIEAATKKMEKMAQMSERLSKARARYDKTLQRAANISLVAGGVDRVGRQALGFVSQPIQQMRMVERSKGELASLGIKGAGLEQVIERGREMSKTLAYVTTQDFVSAAYNIKSSMSNLSDEGVADMTEMAALTAKATMATVDQMTSLFATGYGSFKKSLYAEASDQEFGETLSAGLAKSVQQFNTDGAKMQQAIQAMGSGLAESGVSLADQLTALGMLQQKMQAGVSGTVMNALERSAAQAQERFQKMGIAVDTLDESGNLRRLPGLLADMQQAFGDEYRTEIGAQIQEAFGSEEAVKFFKAIWGQQDAFSKDSKAIQQAMDQGSAFTQVMAKAMDNNMDARLQLLQQRWDIIKEKIGKALIPVLEKLIPLIEKVANWISKLVNNNSAVTTALMAFVGGLGVIAVVTAPVITAIGSLTAAIAMLGLAASRSKHQTAMAGFGGGGKGRGGLGGRGGRGWRGLAKKAGGLMKGKMGIAGAAIGALSIGSTLLDDQLTGRDKAATITKDIGGISGALAGAAAGAAIGSVVPVIGTAIGGIAGSIIGGFGGDWIGEKVGSIFKKYDKNDSLFARINEASNPITKAAAVTVAGTAIALTPAMADVPVAAAAPVQKNDHSTHSYQLTIQQLPGEDHQALADRVMLEIERRKEQRQRELAADGI